MNTATEEKPKKKRKKPDLPIVTIKTTADYQRMKLERLMANPDKPVNIPTAPKTKDLAAPPEFVRNIMGSSAGAGSGEFHVYRHLRRKEYARQKYIQEKAKIEEREKEFENKIEQNLTLAEIKTAKKRAKRLKKKQKQKAAKRSKPNTAQKKTSSQKDSDSSSDSDTEEPTSNSPSAVDNDNTNSKDMTLGEASTNA